MWNLRDGDSKIRAKQPEVIFCQRVGPLIQFTSPWIFLDMKTQ
jgi:hypothetical protein